MCLLRTQRSQGPSPPSRLPHDSAMTLRMAVAFYSSEADSRLTLCLQLVSVPLGVDVVVVVRKEQSHARLDYCRSLCLCVTTIEQHKLSVLETAKIDIKVQTTGVRRIVQDSDGTATTDRVRVTSDLEKDWLVDEICWVQNADDIVQTCNRRVCE